MEARTLKGTTRLVPQLMLEWSAKGRQWSANLQMWADQARLGDVAELKFTTSREFAGDMIIGYTRAPDYGNVRVSLDGQPIATINGYASRVEPAAMLVTVPNLRPGQHSLRLEVLSKNDQSSGFMWGLDYIGFPGPPLTFLTDYEEARKTAAQQGKRFLIFFAQPGVSASDYFEKKLFANPLVSNALSNYVLLKLSFPTNAEFARQFQVFRAGAVVVYEGDGTPVALIKDSLPPQEFLRRLGH